MATLQAPAPASLKRRMKRKTRALPAIITILVVAAVGWFGWQKTHPPVDPNASLLTATVTRGDLLETVTATGSVTAQTGAQVKIGSQITGTIKRLYADVGSRVKAGQIIAELNLPDIDAQVNQAQATLQQAQIKLAQQLSGQNLQRTTTSTAVQQAQANLNSVRARLATALANANLQATQTPQDVKRAETALRVAQAALSTARSTQAQTQASANLQIATAQESVTQAKANAVNAGLTLQRNLDLLKKGFVAQSVVDAAVAQNDVNRSQVDAAQQNVSLVKAKVNADLQTASDQVIQAQQNVAAAEAALVTARAGKFSDLARQAEVRDARAAVSQAEANLRAAQAGTANDVLKDQDIQQAREAVRIAQAQLDYNKAQLDKTFIRSPISGTVLQLASQQGETLAAGLSAPTLIIVADLNRLQIDVFVDETDIGKVKLGQEAGCTVDAFPKKVFRGEVTKIASGSTIQQGVVTYDVTVAIEDPKHQLKPDMTANCVIQTGKRQGVLLVPSEAIKVGTRGSTVNVLKSKNGKDGKPDIERVKVKTGGSDGVNTEIREGVKEGDVIVLAGMEDPNRRQFGPQSPFGASGGGRGGGGGGGGGRRGGG